MNKPVSRLREKIAQLGMGLASGEFPQKSEVIEPIPSRIKRPTKNLCIYLNAPEVVQLAELQIWARKNQLCVGWGTMMKAGLALLRKDERSLNALRQVVRNDGRRNRKSIVNSLRNVRSQASQGSAKPLHVLKRQISGS